jgi:hypothetical protein
MLTDTRLKFILDFAHSCPYPTHVTERVEMAEEIIENRCEIIRLQEEVLFLQKEVTRLRYRLGEK